MRSASLVLLLLACAAPALADDEMGRQTTWSAEDQRTFHLACRQVKRNMDDCECTLRIYQEYFPTLDAFRKNRVKSLEKAMFAEASRRCGGDERSGK